MRNVLILIFAVLTLQGCMAKYVVWSPDGSRNVCRYKWNDPYGPQRCREMYGSPYRTPYYPAAATQLAVQRDISAAQTRLERVAIEHAEMADEQNRQLREQLSVRDRAAADLQRELDEARARIQALGRDLASANGGTAFKKRAYDEERRAYCALEKRTMALLESVNKSLRDVRCDENKKVEEAK